MLAGYKNSSYKVSLTLGEADINIVIPFVVIPVVVEAEDAIFDFGLVRVCISSDR